MTIRYFWKEWQNKGASHGIVKLLRVGYKFPLVQTPPCPKWIGQSGETESKLLDLVQQKPANSGTINCQESTVEYSLSQSHRDNGVQYWINLSTLNKYVHIYKFKMESIRNHTWTTSIDMLNAYLHVLMHSKFKKFRRFYIQGQVHQFLLNLFCLGSAPIVSRQVKSELKQIGSWQMTYSPSGVHSSDDVQQDRSVARTGSKSRVCCKSGQVSPYSLKNFPVCWLRLQFCEIYGFMLQDRIVSLQSLIDPNMALLCLSARTLICPYYMY